MLTIRSGRNPYEVAVLVALLVSGIGGLISPRRVSGATIASLPSAWQYIWYAGMAALSGIALLGVTLFSLHGLLIERVGLLGLAVMLTCYSITLVVLYGPRVIPTGSVMMALAVANVVRVKQIRRDVEQVRVQLRGG